ncbi:diencephalon/mesencephalon homeobox protein 1-A-like [Montipora foliosa]|uniref:diencephalon/mesencephalon homeobox protein 1-A-like n=1 Tax=Montipora foliosa TaxID=591990 RepID=UPI0035F19E2B
MTPDVVEAAHLLLMMKHGMKAFIEAQQARFRIPYSLYYASLNPSISAQLHYFANHGFPFSAPFYDFSPMPTSFQFPLTHAQSFSIPLQDAYYGMLNSSQCMAGPPGDQRLTGTGLHGEKTEEHEKTQPVLGLIAAVTKKARLSTNATTSLTAEQIATSERQDAKRKRKNLTKEQLEILESVYEKEKYPHMDDRIKLEKPTNLTEDRIQVWFQNRRAKDRKKMEAEKLQQCLENTSVLKDDYLQNHDTDERKASAINSSSEASDNER